MTFNQAWERATRPRPIVIIGAGAIVRNAHIPAYRKLGYPIAGLFDVRPEAAAETAAAFGVETVFSSLKEAVRVPDSVFDIAVPGSQILSVLGDIPNGSAVLIQKPMGESLDEARVILRVCHEKRLKAAVNFQLRFSPNMLELRHLLLNRTLGTVTDIEVRVVDHQPWEQWTFLKEAPRLEILYHSIHYLDVLRFLFDEPCGVHCLAVRHPGLEDFQDTRSTIILDYDDWVRCSLTLNHTHFRNDDRRCSELTVEGTLGTAVLTMGVNLDYPSGKPDTMKVALGKEDWHTIPLRGSWFIEAFEGPMSNLQRFVAGEDDALISSVDDASLTMALVESCYRSSTLGMTPIAAV